MLNTSPSNLIQEITVAEETRDTFLHAMEPRVEHWTGPDHRNVGDRAYLPENDAHEYLANTLPAMVMDNPRVRASTRKKGSARMVAQAIEHAINRWVRDTDFQCVAEPLAVDQAFSFSFSKVVRGTPPGRRRQPADPNWPSVQRISQRRMIVDPLAQSFDAARYAGHMWVVDKDDLLRRAKDNPEEGWDAGAIEALSEDTDLDKLHRDKQAAQNAPSRKEVAVYTLWVPDATEDVEDHPGPKEGFHGSLYTLSSAMGEQRDPSGEQAREKGLWLRKPRPYFGPRWGPYNLGGAYVVPDCLYPLAPLQASAGQARDLNAQAQALTRSAQSYKRLVLADASNPKLVEALANKPDNYVVPVTGFQKDQAVAIEVGGFTQQQLEAVMVMRDRLDRISGITESKRGNVSGSATATAEAIADNALGARQAFIKRKFTRHIAQILRTVGWHFYYDEDIVFEMEPESGEMILDMMTGLPAANPIFMGGSHDVDSGLTFDDIELVIEPYSMEFTSEAMLQRNATLAMETMMGIAPLIPMTPWVHWDRVLEQLGNAFNMPNLGRLIDLGIAGRMSGMQMGGPEPVARIGSMAGPNAQRAGQQQTPRLAGQQPAPRQAPSATQGLNQSASFGQQQSQMRIGA